MKKRIYIILLLLSVSIFAHASERKVIDMDGREVTLNKKIESVVTIGGTPALNVFLFAIGKANVIKNGVRDNSLKRFPIWKTQSYFLKNLYSMPQVSSNPPDWNPNFEVLMSMKFDVGFVNNRIMAERLEEKGIKTVVMHSNQPNGVKETMIFLGELFQEEERVAKYLDYFDNNINMIHSITNKDQFKKKKAIYVRLDNMTTSMMSSTNELLVQAGAITSSSDLMVNNTSLNIEKLLVWNPDVLFVWSRNDLNIAYKDERFKNLTAVKNKEVYVVPMGAFLWTFSTPEQPLAALWCAKKMYPESFNHIDINVEAKKFYKEFMNEELTDEQLDSILNR
ncbi:MAG: ABC transporter substrate-binding protein [Sulfurovum sp.]|nr:ABC transporter substrate-binding protein [Sulfurovum sp.]MDD3498774.1 ABC transporter substrate-binding protein [Sulfurovum sp.]